MGGRGAADEVRRLLSFLPIQACQPRRIYGQKDGQPTRAEGGLALCRAPYVVERNMGGGRCERGSVVPMVARARRSLRFRGSRTERDDTVADESFSPVSRRSRERNPGYWVLESVG